MSEALPLTRIRPPPRWPALELATVWGHRDLLRMFVWRDVKVRYKQTIIGIAWAIVQPTMTMLVLSFVFGTIAGLPSEGVPYPIYVFAGVLPWTYFATSVMASTNSVVDQANLLTKVYFPRLVLPFSGVLGGLVDLAFASLVLGVLFAFYGYWPSPNIFFAPFIIAAAGLTALSVGILLSALNALYRDVRYVLPFLIQIGLFATPVAYGSAAFPERWEIVLVLNPMATVTEAMRWSLLGLAPPTSDMVLASCAIVGSFLVLGLFVFRRMESHFADRV